jgi:crossover junction endodeoxyribonuclease RuvC
MKAERILGIDPGFGRIGYGVIEQKNGLRLRPNGTTAGQGDWQAVGYGCITTDPKTSFVERLKCLHEELVDVIKQYKPNRMAVEELFFFKNLKTAIEVAQARGVILLTAIENNLEVDEFTPLQVKQAMTGYGRAEKGQMQKIVAMILKISGKIKSDDAADALAIALAAGQSLWYKEISS